jgi:hypothetical protein
MKIKILLINLFTFFHSMEKEEESVPQLNIENKQDMAIDILVKNIIDNINHTKQLIKRNLIEINNNTINNILNSLKDFLNLSLEEALSKNQELTQKITLHQNNKLLSKEKKTKKIKKDDEFTRIKKIKINIESCLDTLLINLKQERKLMKLHGNSNQISSLKSRLIKVFSNKDLSYDSNNKIKKQKILERHLKIKDTKLKEFNKNITKKKEKLESLKNTGANEYSKEYILNVKYETNLGIKKEEKELEKIIKNGSALQVMEEEIFNLGYKSEESPYIILDSEEAPVPNNLGCKIEKEKERIFTPKKMTINDDNLGNFETKTYFHTPKKEEKEKVSNFTNNNVYTKITPQKEVKLDEDFFIRTMKEIEEDKKKVLEKEGIRREKSKEKYKEDDKTTCVLSNNKIPVIHVEKLIPKIKKIKEIKSSDEDSIEVPLKNNKHKISKFPKNIKEWINLEE